MVSSALVFSLFMLLFPEIFPLLTEALFAPAVDAEGIERWTDEILGAESIKEYKAIFQKLGETRTNRVFQFFEIKAPSAPLP